MSLVTAGDLVAAKLKFVESDGSAPATGSRSIVCATG